ncbi:MAG: ribose-phosphate pyrophosphokinase [Dehalococcoidales bacterium]|nr:ribose-phosphate pyrophosphokinase [Dehalococcoidales bacterium]
MAKVSPLLNGLTLITGRANPALAHEVSAIIGIPLCDIHTSTFPDSETHVQVEESLRGKDVFIIQPTCPPVNDNLMELLIMIDACRRASARQVNAIVPYFGYGRQDHKSTGREPITAKLVADIISVAGASRVVAVDLHSAPIQGFFNIPMDHLTAVPLLAESFKKAKFKNAVIVSPDLGGTKLAEKYTDILHLPMAVMSKRRKGIGGREVEFFVSMGEVKGKIAIITDDVITSGSTMKLVDILLAAGAKEVFMAVTHPVLAASALDRVRSSPLKQLVVTNTIAVPENKLLGGKIKVVSLAPLLAKVIKNIHENTSVSQIFTEQHINFPV